MRRVFATIAVLLAMTLPARAQVYPNAGIVTEVEVSGDKQIVTVTEFGGSGNQWVFEIEADYHIGDVCAMLMDDMGTEIIYDDEIVGAHYCGFIF